MKRTTAIFISIFFLFLFSCKKEYSKVDGSSDKAFKASIESISSKLTVLQQDKIQEAIKLIYKFKTTGADENQRWQQIYTLLDGKNADQIFDIAEEIAKENKIAWSSTSMNNLDESIFEEDDKPLTDEEKKLKQIEAATRINIRFSPANKDYDLNDGFYLYPDLVDDADTSIPYSNLTLELSISFINNGTVVYVTKKTVNSSEVGNPSLNKGIKIPYSMFDKSKMANASIDVEIRLNAGDKYLFGRLTNIPIDLSKTRETSASIEDEMNAQIGLDIVKNFIQSIGAKNYSKAYSLTQNPKWDTEAKFSSPSNGFGAIEDTNLLTTEVINIASDKLTIYAIYQIKDKNTNVKTLKQNFILKKNQDNWVITDTETKEVKPDNWQQ